MHCDTQDQTKKLPKMQCTICTLKIQNFSVEQWTHPQRMPYSWYSGCGVIPSVLANVCNLANVLLVRVAQFDHVLTLKLWCAFGFCVINLSQLSLLSNCNLLLKKSGVWWLPQNSRALLGSTRPKLRLLHHKISILHWRVLTEVCYLEINYCWITRFLIFFLTSFKKRIRNKGYDLAENINSTELNHLQMSWVVFNLIIELLFLLKATDVLFHIMVYKVSRTVIKSGNRCGKTGHAPPIVSAISWLESPGLLAVKLDLFAHFLWLEFTLHYCSPVCFGCTLNYSCFI